MRNTNRNVQFHMNYRPECNTRQKLARALEEYQVECGGESRITVEVAILGAGAALLAVLLILKKKDAKRGGKKN